MEPGDERRYGVDIEAYDRWLVWGHGLRLRRGRGPDFAQGGTEPADDEPRLGDQGLLEASLAAVAPSGPQVVAHFYHLLFTENRNLRALFPDSMGPQREKLLGALIAAVKGAADPQSLVATLEQLGRDHRKFGVRPAHYATVGKALLATLAHFAGAAWTPEVEQAWSERYTFAARTMLAAAESDSEHPPYWYGTLIAHQRYLPDVAIIRVRPHQPYDFAPGQHATVISPRVPRIWQPFVLTHAVAADGLLEFHVRAGLAGGLADTLVTDAKVGDSIRIGAPLGQATLRPPSQLIRVFLTHGVGWAQTKAYLMALSGPQPTPGYLLYIGRPDTAAYDPDFRQVLHHCPWLTPTFVATAQEAVHRLPPPRTSPQRLEVYLSGQLETVRPLLVAAGVPATQIVGTTW